MRFLWLELAMVITMPCLAGLERVYVDNQTTDILYVSRLGAPGVETKVYDSRMAVYVVPLVGAGGESIEMLRIRFPDGTTLSEPSFRGYSAGPVRQLSLIITPPRNVQVSYSGGTADQPVSAQTNSGGVAGDGYYGTGFGRQPGYGNGYLRNSGTSNFSSNRNEEKSAEFKNGTRKIILPEIGPKVTLVPQGRYRLDVPTPLTGKPREPLKTGSTTPAGSEHEAEPGKHGLGPLATWVFVCICLAGFVFWKRLSNQ